ncbi:MAG: hypothetical protein KKA65_05125 [Nanoarchaeota archaeon]|nr:hypothetical protein [Nanoarchaeota archaeon]MBU4242295.1 hypothetical protein [Nanoarchaeota archaeon]MBU4352498.1 hypothetical protein [Nanoarchaeota archaeon]MBU4456856.1 hypothetical protein [Nanoarchaeota archaeon]MCG2719353.1 hypothetical protein [Nanoarchaeota archaeon]
MIKPHIGFHETMSGYYWNPMDPRLASKCCCSKENCCLEEVLEETPTLVIPQSDYPLPYAIFKGLMMLRQKDSGIEKKDFLKEFGKKFEFTVDAEAPLHKFVNPKSKDFMLTKLEGVVTMEDVCENLPIRNGELLLDFFDHQQLIYYFDFEAEGRMYTYGGQKDLDLKHPLNSMTTLSGEIYERLDEKAMSVYMSECKFDLKDLPQFLFSFLQGLKVK